MQVTKNIYNVGVNDREVDLFEGQYIVPNGMAYNSYLIIDEKIALLDTVAQGFYNEWLKNIKDVLGDKKVDFLIVQHMEPDHSYNVMNFLKENPQTKVVASSKAFIMMKNFFGEDFLDRQVVVGENSTLSLGERTITFVTAPMVHWPEVIMTYDAKDQVVFSADGFGKFGALDTDEEWACEARRYYFGIVGKYGAPVQTLLKKIGGLPIKTICPLHGPVLTENLGYYINLYNVWSSYQSEVDGTFIAYTSVYGNTKKVAMLLKDELEKRGEKVAISDLARDDMAECVEDAFKYSKLVLATTTYNGDIFPFMKTFIDALVERNYQNKKVGFIENGSWAPVAYKKMQAMLEKSKNLTFMEQVVTILSACSKDNLEQISNLADQLLNK